MSDLETLAESSTYWGLVERYADAAPDAVVAGDDRGDVAAVADLAPRGAGRAAAGTPRPPPPAPPGAGGWLSSTGDTARGRGGARHSDRTVIAGGLSMLSVGMGHGWRFGTVAPFAHIGGPA